MPDTNHAPMHTVDPAESDPRATTTILVGAVSAILLFVIVVLLEVLYYRTSEAELFRKVISAEPQALRSLQVDQLQRLQGYGWVDEKAEVVTIPIERAMELIVEERGDGPTDR